MRPKGFNFGATSELSTLESPSVSVTATAVKSIVPIEGR